ncbi:inorganic diphosphatase [Sphingomonas sp. MAH-6]|nr:inorganic diphosphatase [Sphingomonas chungangi]
MFGKRKRGVGRPLSHCRKTPYPSHRGSGPDQNQQPTRSTGEQAPCPPQEQDDRMDLAAIAHRLDAAEGICRVVIETPKGSRSKYTWDSSIEAFELSALLPAGMSFPLDFGLVPSTLADDGDPLDIFVIGDEPAAVGCVIDVHVLGVIKAEQTERGRTFRNDRLIGRGALSVSYDHARHVSDLGKPFVDHLGRWFSNYNALKGKGFEVIGIGDSAEAIRIILEATRRCEASRNAGTDP